MHATYMVGALLSKYNQMDQTKLQMLNQLDEKIRKNIPPDSANVFLLYGHPIVETVLGSLFIHQLHGSQCLALDIT